MTRGQKMKALTDEIARIDAEIERLRARRQAFVDALGMTSGNIPAPAPRRRSANVKPLILDIMREADTLGATSIEVLEKVKAKVPTVAKDTVGSVLSRLKADRALSYDGERYYDIRFAPKPSAPFEETARAVH